MKIFMRVVGLLFVALVIAGLAAYAVQLRLTRGETLSAQESFRCRAAELTMRMSAVDARCRVLIEQGIVQSNRADAVEAKYDEERATTEPLRRQLEQMMTQNIGLTAQLETAQEALRTAQAEAAALKGEGEKAAQMVATLQADVARLTASESDLKVKLTAAQAQVAALEKERQPPAAGTP